jgi:hypothetical protein
MERAISHRLISQPARTAAPYQRCDEWEAKHARVPLRRVRAGELRCEEFLYDLKAGQRAASGRPRPRIPSEATACTVAHAWGASMSSKTPQQEEPQPKGFRGKLFSTAGGIASLITVGVFVAGAVGYGIKYMDDKHTKTPEAEYERLAKLKAGITLSRFQAILEREEVEVVTSGSGDLIRHLYARPYDYVLAVTDKNQRVVSFSVMVRKQNFIRNLVVSNLVKQH